MTVGELPVILALMAVAFAAGFVDAVAGGGGLLTVPALLLAGLPPVEAVATNKLQGTFGVAMSSYAYWRGGHLELRPLVRPVVWTAIGAGLGGVLVTHLDPNWLKTVVPVVLVVIAIYFMAGPKLEANAARQRRSDSLIGIGVGLPVGLYDGFLGPGAGSFYLMGLVVIGGFGLLAATAGTKLLNLTSNAVALVVLLVAGKVSFAIGLPMAVGQVLGARLGARAAVRFGATIIRPMVVVVSLAMAARLLWAG